MDEYVIVRFDQDDRVVLVDGRPGGLTNRLMLTERGTYDFSLQGQTDYMPASQKVIVENTTEQSPLIVRFTRNPRFGSGTSGAKNV